MRTRFFGFACFLALIFIFTGLSGCSKDSPNEPEPLPGPEVEQRAGVLEINDGLDIGMDDLEVYSFADSGDIGEDGAFKLDATLADKPQMLLISSKETGNPVYIGLYDPYTQSVLANDSSTALALALMNPYLIYTDLAKRQEYIDAVKQSPYFTELIELLRQGYVSDPETVLSYEDNPLIFQKVVYLMRDALESMGGAKALIDYEGYWDPPYIEDAEGTNINFISPRHTWYVAGVYPNGGDQLDGVVTLDRKETVVSLNWGWPPVVLTEPAETEYDIGNGTFKVHVTQGYDYSKVFQLDDPVGRATLYNTGQGIIYFVDLVVGIAVVPNFIELPQHLHISAHRTNKLIQAITSQDVSGFVVEFSKLIIDNTDEITYWIWQETQNTAATHFLKNVGHLLGDVCFVLKILGFANEQFPFFADIAFAPHDVTYYLAQENGDLVSAEEDYPPVPAFDITPPAGIIGASFTFDGTDSYDDNDALASLQFRWDFDGDGSWNTSWSSSATANYTYSEEGSYTVIMEVKDSRDLAATTSRTLNVGGGAGTATHIKLMRDMIPWYADYAPWNIDATVAVIEALGFTPGTSGENTYEIIPSSQFSTVDLIPGQDLVIISNDQNQAFYDNYAANQIRFNNFVYGGGAMLWEACDNGWNAGLMDAAGVILPSNVHTQLSIDMYNFVSAQSMPLVAGLPYQMDHNYASHESFVDLPGGTTIYCIDTDENPTLVEFNFGSGWIIMTGQPLEHQYRSVYGSPDMEELLPRIVAYFTGKDMPAKKLVPRAGDDEAPASIPPSAGRSELTD